MDPKDRYDCLAFFWKTKDVPDKERMIVEVNRVKNPHLIFFNVLDEAYNEVFIPLMESLQEMYRAADPNDIIPKSKLKIALPCVVRYQNVFFRGVIISKKPEYVQVRTIDYGVDVTITRAEYDTNPLYWLNRNLAKIPIQGIAGGLKFLEPVGKSWSTEATIFLMDLLQDREVNAIIIKKNLPGGVVDFCLECPETGENIEIELVKAGLARFTGEFDANDSDFESEEEDNESEPIKPQEEGGEDRLDAAPLPPAEESNSFFTRAIHALDNQSSGTSYSDDDLDISVHVYSSDGSIPDSPCHESKVFDFSNEPDGGLVTNDDCDMARDQDVNETAPEYRTDERLEHDEEEVEEMDEVEEEEEFSGNFAGSEEEQELRDGDKEKFSDVQEHRVDNFRPLRLAAPSETLTSVSMVGRLSDVNIASIKDMAEREKVKQEIVLEMQSLQQRLAELNCILSSEGEENSTVPSTPLSPSAPEFVPKLPLLMPCALSLDSGHSDRELRVDADVFIPKSIKEKTLNKSLLRPDAAAFSPTEFDVNTEAKEDENRTEYCERNRLHPEVEEFVPKSARYSELPSFPPSQLSAMVSNLPSTFPAPTPTPPFEQMNFHNPSYFLRHPLPPEFLSQSGFCGNPVQFPDGHGFF